jgi:CheY-like chemotaxis protein
MKKILVVDDEENIRELYREELEELGYEVTTVSSGTAALELMETKTFDLVTLDIRMPDMDGLETLGKIKEKNNALPVILCTAYPDYKQDFGSWSSDAYVVKSSNTSQLRDTVKKLLG